MNDKFFSLPEEKQQRIINAGFRIFSQNSYRKSPVSEIADAAGISKSLLFYYFKNKRELYVFLWERCAQITIDYLTEYGCYEKSDLFDMIYQGMRAKLEIMRHYPDIGAFAIKAFYEKDDEISGLIQASYEKMKAFKAENTLKSLDSVQFREGIDLKMMYREMYLASEGYLWEMVQREDVDVDRMEKDFTGMIEFWKKAYTKEGGSE